MSDQTESTNPITIDIVKDLLPKTVTLGYVDYRDNFDENLECVQKAIREREITPIFDEGINEDWLWDNEWESMKYYVEELRMDLKSGGYEEDDIEEFLQDNEDWIRDIIGDRNDADIIGDLLRNTSDPVMFYDLNVYIDECGYDNELVEYSVKRIKKALGILQKEKKYDKDLTMMVEQASYGGRLVIYFRKDVEDMIETKSYNTIQFSNPMVAIIDTYNGSGDNVDLEGVIVTLPYNPENVFIDKLIKYNYTYEVCGMYGGWCDCTGVKFVNKKYRKPIEKKKSSLYAEIEREEKYKETYKKGGCTFGDMDMKRHRNTYYINDFPCGTKCKDCGTFWID